MAGSAIVYLATNRLNGKRYIGATAHPLDFRRRQHEWQSLYGKRVMCRIFHAAIKKYGLESFDWSVLSECESFDDAMREEIRLIAEMRPEYNLTIGGNGAKGRVVSAEQRRKHSQVMKGRSLSPEAIAKIVAKNTGRRRTPEQRERMGAARRGKPFSDEHKKNLSLSRLGKTLTVEHRRNIGVGLMHFHHSESGPQP